MKNAMAFLLLVFVGCTAIQQTQLPTDQPELIAMAPLPQLRPVHSYGGLRLNVVMHILEDGRIDQARMLGSSGDTEWDSLALESVRQWRFAPTIRDGVPVDCWVRQLLIVQIQDPIVMPLEELVASSLQEADSLYALLEGGVDFDSLLRGTGRALTGPHGRILGEVNIAIFAPHVREELRTLKEGEITRPLRVDGNFLIYKRIPKDLSSRM